MKLCFKCRETKEESAFAKSQPRTCRECAAKYRRDHRDRIVAYLRKYYADNKPSLLAKQTAYRNAHAKQHRAKASEWQKNNLERVRIKNAKWRELNATKSRAFSATWRKANPAKLQVNSARRRAVRHAAPGQGVTVTQWKDVLRESLGLCAYCNAKLPLTVDHIDPLFRGGEHDRTNLVAACGSCNSSKRDKPLIVWLAQRQQRKAA
ncbi:MAG: HNH endonuclease [Gemmatimonadaceae bacterium]|nr:HNH endonuclease [Gemmatimonadaceae bacterium]